MSKYNLKNNPELAKERHREQNRAWYQRNKEYVMAMQRERRATQRLMKRHLVADESYLLEKVWTTIRKNDYSAYANITIDTSPRMANAFNNYHKYLNKKDD